MRVAMLGPVTAFGADGAPLRVGGPRVRALLALLALEPGKAVSAERLIDAIWAGAPPANAANALQTLVKRLRAALAPARVVEARAPGYALAVDPDDVDAHRFARLLAEGARLLADGAADRAAIALDAALALWRGQAVADLADFPQLIAGATLLDEQRLGAVEARADAYLALGRAAEVVRELSAEAAAHPLRETVAARLITALAAAGRRPEALEVFLRTKGTLCEELGVDPSPALTDAYLAALRDRPCPARERPTTNLRGRLTSFVGRAAEVDRIGGLLGTSRLLTLVGPGGAGKTRLAGEVAARLTERWPDGCWLVELAAVADSASVVNAVSAAIGFGEHTETPNPNPVEQLAAVLAGKRLLLVVDNCEHVVAGAAALVEELLARCPGLTVLATSREPLGVDGEVLCPVPPLEVAPDGATAQEAARFAAVRLFVDRASAARPGFVLDEDNCAAVCAICHRLDGMPLAIELAAARLRAMSPGQIADRLDDRFRLLTSGARTALPRHQTLRAVVAWSWDLLTEPEQILARRLSVFVGGATLEGAERVCGGDVLDALPSLVDKSLVELDGDRYRMLETIRAYAAEELAARDDAAALAKAHAAYFRDLAELAEPALRTANQDDWFARLAAEHDNCVAALGWAVRDRDTALALRLCGALVWYWLPRGFRTEAELWRRRVLDLAGGGPPAGLTAAYLACSYACCLPEYTGWSPARRLGGSAVAFGRLHHRARAEDRPPNPVFTALTAVWANEAGDPSAFQECVRSPDQWLASTALLLRGTVRLNQGGDGPAADLEAAVLGFRRVGERRGLSRALLALATLRARTDGVAAAAELMTEAAELITPWVCADEALVTLIWLAQLRSWDGDLAGAAAAIAAARRTGTSGVPVDTLVRLRLIEADLASRAGDLVVAIPRHQEARSGLAQADRAAPVGEIWARISHGIALADTGDPGEAEAKLREALDLMRPVRNLPLLVALGVGFAVAALASGDPVRAAAIMEACAVAHEDDGLGDPDPVRVRGAARTDHGVDRPDRAAGTSDDLIRLLRAG
ncbi:AfsR/SARP family transcriptional regulator [Solihabitans fulvus]|uniref:AfsR/SARP family transcriptional regulator n=1 Tax=Solihabitans fulvus TaxID=1892852 RepID=A0A5B2XB40_9PSEU|nr:BTAD domain-containing putative transcriptional regulator [Solihabitans fulvus]KAA2260443.1 AfsR/SARP family transcriptional regulator [Solihabitans fulvus]